MRAVVREFDLPESSVRMRLKRKVEDGSGVKPPKIGRPTVIPPNEEKCLADSIGVLCRNGFSPSMEDIRSIVGEYVIENKISTPFTNGIPGRRWISRFMAWNNMTLKKVTMISRENKDCTSNPFTRFDFYEQLGKTICNNNLSADQIWNMDETTFPCDPKKADVRGTERNKSITT